MNKLNSIYSSLFLLIFINQICCENKPMTFSTWEGFEVDKCASIWLLKNFIDSNVEIKFFPKGTIIKEGIAFDTPGAKLRRYHNMSTFEAILKEYQLKDPKLDYIARIIHDIEINIWDRKIMAETQDVKYTITSIIMESKDNNCIINKSLTYFDLLYKTIRIDQ